MKNYIFETIVITCSLFCINCFSQRKYTVKVWNGIAIQKTPSFTSDSIGKLNYNHQFEVEEDLINKRDTIVENGFKIPGNWVTIQTSNIKDYVFDGYTKRDYNNQEL